MTPKFKFKNREDALQWAGNLLYKDIRRFLKYHPTGKATTMEEAQSEDDLAHALCMWDGTWPSSPFKEGENGVRYDVKTNELKEIKKVKYELLSNRSN